jgi:hypothetical protein
MRRTGMRWVRFVGVLFWPACAQAVRRALASALAMMTRALDRTIVAAKWLIRRPRACFVSWSNGIFWMDRIGHPTLLHHWTLPFLFGVNCD